jgi:polysaccharide export outer membrane protein
MTPRQIRIATIALVFVQLVIPLAPAEAADQKALPASSASQTTSGEQNLPPFAERQHRYQLHMSDVIDISFPLSPEFNQSVVVQPDGYVSLNGVGTIHAEGETLDEFSASVKKAYSPILHDPIVSLSLKDFEKPYFIVGGQVGKPGKYDLRSPTTVTEAVQIAGGFTTASKHSQVVLFRPVGDGMSEARLLDIKKMLNSRNLSEDATVRPGDIIFVPQNTYSKIERYIPTPAYSFSRPLP